MAKIDPEGPSCPVPIYEMPGFLLRVARQRSAAYFEPIAEKYGITPQQYSILRTTHQHPHIDQNDLGERVSLDGSTISEMVKRMEQRGLLQRRSEGRYRRLTLTDKALKLLRQVHPEVVRSQAQLLSSLTARERDRLMQLLSKLVDADNRYHAPRRRATRAPRPG